MRTLAIYAAIIISVLPGRAAGEVADSAAGGFTLKTTLEIKATPDEVYRKMLHVGDWWASSHTYSGDAHNLSLEEKAGGCWCETLPKGGGVKHMEVVYFVPGKIIRLAGALGPLQAAGATGALQFQFSPTEGGTKMQVTYAVSGYLPAGLNTWAAGINTVLMEQLDRLKNYAEGKEPQAK